MSLMGRTVYVVTMYRWGDRERHSYPLGAFSTPELAAARGAEEQEHRGGDKYQPEVVSFELDGAERPARGDRNGS